MSDLKMEYLKETYMKRINEIGNRAKGEIEKATEEYNRELEKQNTRQWIPAEEERYWCIDNNGWALTSNWKDDASDRSRLEIGNVYKTREEAKFECERLKVLAIMKKYSRPFVQGDENYYMELNHKRDNIEVSSYFLYDSGVYHFESEEMAQRAIDEIGKDRLKKYYFRIED